MLILTEACTAVRPAELVHSDEHVNVAEFAPDVIRTGPIPLGYLRAIELATTAGAGAGAPILAILSG